MLCKASLSYCYHTRRQENESPEDAGIIPLDVIAGVPWSPSIGSWPKPQRTNETESGWSYSKQL